MLSAYLDAAMDQPWSWGVMYCCLFGSEWVRLATGRDPLEPYRGTHDSALGARRLIAARGGLVRMIGAEMERCGFERTACPDHGDIGACRTSGVVLEKGRHGIDGQCKQMIVRVVVVHTSPT